MRIAHNYATDAVVTCLPSITSPCISHSFFLGRGYIGARTDTTYQVLSGHTSSDMCVATFNPTCLSRLLATKVLPVLSLFIVSDVNGT